MEIDQHKKRYHRGSLKQFEAWENAVRAKLNIPSNNGKTTAYSSPRAHPDNDNDVIWIFGDYPSQTKQQYSLKEVKDLGFLSSDPLFAEQS